nr:TetR/AcrR family transcriptional regulator [Solimonas sp. K1W22B-7]
MQKLSEIPHVGGLDDSPRGRVLRAAAHLFRSQGYERTTVRDMAQLVGILSGSLFHHFKTKEDILCAVMEEAITYNTARMQEAVDLGKTPKERLGGLIRAELEAVNGNTSDAMAVLIHEWESLSKENQQRLLGLREHYQSLWLGVMTDCRNQGLVPHDPFIWRLLIGGSISWTATWYRQGGEVSLDQLAAMVLDMALKG